MSFDREREREIDSQTWIQRTVKLGIRISSNRQQGPPISFHEHLIAFQFSQKERNFLEILL
jgi:hypothetical protein